MPHGGQWYRIIVVALSIRAEEPVNHGKCRRGNAEGAPQARHSRMFSQYCAGKTHAGQHSPAAADFCQAITWQPTGDERENNAAKWKSSVTLILAVKML